MAPLFVGGLRRCSAIFLLGSQVQQSKLCLRTRSYCHPKNVPKVLAHASIDLLWKIDTRHSCGQWWPRKLDYLWKIPNRHLLTHLGVTQKKSPCDFKTIIQPFWPISTCIHRYLSILICFQHDLCIVILSSLVLSNLVLSILSHLTRG